MPLVNLFVVGAMKSGSTTLHEYLDRHPEVCMSSVKEPGYFVPELWKNKPDSAYEGLFVSSAGERYFGESSTHYSKFPTYEGVPERIYEYNPSARIIYIMRHPIRRLISHYYHALRDVDFYGETRPILKAIKKDPMYIAYSDYAAQLEPYYRLFGKDQVHVLTFEELVANPQAELNSMMQWLGLSTFDVEERKIQANQTPQRFRRARGVGLLNRLRHTRAWDRISSRIPKSIRRMGVRLAESPDSRKLSDGEERALWRTLTPVFVRKVEALEHLSERKYRIWSLGDHDGAVETKASVGRSGPDVG